MNAVTLIGRLATSVELRSYDERRRATFLLLVERGESRGVDFVPVVCWNEIADGCSSLAKGDRLALDGSVRSRRWKDAEGRKRDAVEVVANETHRLPQDDETRRIALRSPS